ncbi:hypothetical protein FLL46_06645 [Aliikangiella coralliicola]|uniref:Uncharacterized protein n=2 Tax=Aliikangiella coralliicola TaxID=2592383 RepID=A0A545UGV2_9GAMM|nr:hypothetical protein FLL46_06645 [Aliikangiella coralliicola]
MKKVIRITHKPTNTILAEGPKGWGITFFEGNYYIQKKYLKTDGLKVNYIPGLCVYKFLYVWLDLHIDGCLVTKNIGWKYWLPNPLLPFIFFRTALPGVHPELSIEIS